MRILLDDSSRSEIVAFYVKEHLKQKAPFTAKIGLRFHVPETLLFRGDWMELSLYPILGQGLYVEPTYNSTLGPMVCQDELFGFDDYTAEQVLDRYFRGLTLMEQRISFHLCKLLMDSLREKGQTSIGSLASNLEKNLNE